ncbi:WD40 repeat domain-containing protein, partial [Armatimonas sp.]|uniref:WD40 repeat domain-containing protein n=1 Tax=Armatimonas sp. TaxID=1872638 RepID=UPI00286C7D89
MISRSACPISPSVPVSQSTVTPTVAQTQARQYTPRPRRRLLARVALWVFFLTPLVALGTLVPSWVSEWQYRQFLQCPEVRESLLVPRGLEAVTSSFSPDGKTLAMVISQKYPKSYSGLSRPVYLSFWDWQTRTERGIQIPLKTWSAPLIWRKSGTELLVPGDQPFLVEVATGKVTPLPGDISLATSPDGTRMIRHSQGKGEDMFHPTSFSVADVDSRKVVAHLALPKSLQQNLDNTTFSRRWSFSPDNAYVVLTVPSNGIAQRNEGVLIYWKVGQEEPLWMVRSDSLRAAVFDSTGERLYTTIHDETVSGAASYTGPHLACLETTTGKKLWSLFAYDAEVLIQGERGFWRNNNNSVHVFDSKTGTQVTELTDNVTDSHGFHGVPELALSHDGKMLAERHEFGIRLRPLAGEKGVP